MDTPKRPFTITTVALSVHREGDSPTCGDSVYLVKLEDDGAGPFVVIEDLSGLGKHDGVAIDLEELPVLLEALKQVGEIATASTAEDEDAMQSQDSTVRVGSISLGPDGMQLHA